MHYGPFEEREKQAAARVLCEAYAATEEEMTRWIDAAGLMHFRGLRSETGAIGAMLLRIPMGHFYGGRSVRAVGIGGVAAALSSRGKGHTSELMREALREARVEGTPLSSLYPAIHPLYRNVGYDLAGARFEIKLRLSEMAVRSEAARALSVRPIGPADTEVVDALYRQSVIDRPGALDRGPYVWKRIRDPFRDPPRGYLITRDDEPVGYAYVAIQTVGAPHYGVRLVDYAAKDDDALTRIALLLGDHGSLGETVSFFGGADDALLAVLRNPRPEIRQDFVFMIRIVDVARALEARGYPRLPFSISLALEIVDEILPQNSGVHGLTVEAGKGLVRPATPTGPRIRGSINALARLYSGAIGAIELARLGALAGDRESLEIASVLFPAGNPSLREMY